MSVIWTPRATTLCAGGPCSIRVHAQRQVDKPAQWLRIRGILDVVLADYAMTVLNNIKLFGRAIRVSKSLLPSDESPTGRNVGANLFLGNLDPETVTEQLLHDTFVVFGAFSRLPYLAKDATTGESKGYGFVSYTNFQSSDTAIDCMNNQYLGNQIITVQYALKKDAEG